MTRKQYIALMTLVCFGLTGCLKVYHHRFVDGDMVQMKIDGRRGMVIGVYLYDDLLDVRFPAKAEITTTPFLGGSREVAVSPYSFTRVREFELEPATQ